MLLTLLMQVIDDGSSNIFFRKKQKIEKREKLPEDVFFSPVIYIVAEFFQNVAEMKKHYPNYREVSEYL